MTTTHFTVRLQRRRDLLLARHLARQVAGLLSFPPMEQARLAAAVFDLACAAYEQPAAAALRFEATETALCVDAVGSPGLMVPPPVRQPLPHDRRLAPEDVGWGMQQLIELAPFRAFAEVARQNREVRWLLAEQRSEQEESAGARRRDGSRAA